MVWQKSMKLVTEVYKVTSIFPKEEAYGLTSQIRRCAVSIPSNIAEGYGRRSTADYVRFLRMATGSLFELQTQLEIAVNVGYLESDDFSKEIDRCREIDRMLSGLIIKITA